MDIRWARFPGNTFAPVIAPLDHSAHRSRAVGSARAGEALGTRSDEFGCPQAFLVKQVIDRRISFLVHRRRDLLPHPLDHVNEARGWPLPRHIHRSWRPPCPRACRPRPGSLARAQEGQGCAHHDVSGRRRAAEAPRVAQKPRTSLTIALTDTAASEPELQRRPCATSRRRGRYPPLRIRRSRTGIGRHAREQRPDGRCNLVASRPRRAAGSAHSTPRWRIRRLSDAE